MDKNGLAKNIIHYRKKKGLSQEKLAEYIGVSRQAVTKWENNISRPSSDSLIKLAQLLEISVDVLLDQEEQKDLSHEKEITTGQMPWILVGISILFILIYLIISMMWDVFSLGTFICLFVLCFPIQMFLHIYFSNAIKNNTFSGIAGFDNKIDYNISEVKKMLVQINLHIGMTSMVYVFLLSVMNCIKSEMRWLNGLLILMYVFDFFAVVMINNYRMTDKIYCNDADQKRAKVIMPVTITYLLLLFTGMGIIGLIFEMKGIENNTIEALKLCGLMILGVIIATIGFLSESQQIKKWNPMNPRYKVHKFSIVSLCLCVIIYGLLFFV